jgi:predicted dehydrogenase
VNALRIGVVGVGMMGRAHVAAVSALPQAEVAWICDPDEGRLEEVGREYTVPNRTRDLDELIASDVEAVVIATPERLHRAPTLAALAAGKDVLLEKPFTTDPGEARELAAAAEQSGRLLFPGYGLRYEPRHRMVKDWLDRGVGGRVVSLYLRRNRPASLFEVYSRTHPAFESSTHDIDLLLWYTGQRAVRVHAVARQREGDANPFGLWSIVELDGGVVATFEAHWIVPTGSRVGRGDLLELVAEHGTAHIDVAHHGTTFWQEDGAVSNDPIYDPNSLSAVSLALRGEVEDFVACVRGERDGPIVSLADAVHGVEIADAMVRSAAQGAPVDL